MGDFTAEDVESELHSLSQTLTAPEQRECLRCFLLRMIDEFGCDGTYRWTIRWRDVQAAQPRGLLRQLSDRGGFCDCEVLVNVYPDYPDVSRPLPCAGLPRPGSAKPCDLRAMRRSA